MAFDYHFFDQYFPSSRNIVNIFEYSNVIVEISEKFHKRSAISIFWSMLDGVQT